MRQLKVLSEEHQATAIEAWATARRRMRSLSFLAKQLGISRQAVGRWEIVPVERAESVERITGVDKRLLCPDMYWGADHHLNPLKSQPVSPQVDEETTASFSFVDHNAALEAAVDACATALDEGPWRMFEAVWCAISTYNTMMKKAPPAVSAQVEAIPSPYVHTRDAREEGVATCNKTTSLVVRAIEAHKAAVAEDEAAYGDDHLPIDEARAECTGRIESALFQTMAIAPCLSHADVQAKVEYLVRGSVGVRTPLIECFGFDEYGGDQVIAGFVKSLLLERV